MRSSVSSRAITGASSSARLVVRFIFVVFGLLVLRLASRLRFAPRRGCCEAALATAAAAGGLSCQQSLQLFI
jgi:hypothetical protein